MNASEREKSMREYILCVSLKGRAKSTEKYTSFLFPHSQIRKSYLLLLVLPRSPSSIRIERPRSHGTLRTITSNEVRSFFRVLKPSRWMTSTRFLIWPMPFRWSCVKGQKANCTELLERDHLFRLSRHSFVPFLSIPLFFLFLSRRRTFVFAFLLKTKLNLRGEFSTRIIYWIASSFQSFQIFIYFSYENNSII